MKKNTFFALVMFMSVIGAVFGQTPATLPYSCDFEASGDNGWTLKNGTCTNQWHVGSFTSPAGHSGSLFISSDGGTTADYDVNAYSVVVAEKLFQTGTSDSLTISFDLTIGGESMWDYLKVYWVNADTVYTAAASTMPYYGSQNYTSNVIMSNATNAYNRFVNKLTGTQTMSVTIANESNTLKKLVFVWVNDESDGSSPGAIIDNLSIIATQTPTPLPYSCDFEASGDNGWLLKNGTCTNQWHVGSFTSPAGHSGSLFISSDGGTTAGYDMEARSVVVAEKLFQTGTSDSLTISFDLTIGGESAYDNLKVYWVDADTVYDASTSWTYYANASYSTNVIMNNATNASYRFVSLLTGTQTMSVTIANEPNTLKKLVFVWRNDSGGGTQPGAIIDNIYINDCDAPTALAVSNITETSAELSWNGTAAGYEVRLNGGTPETVSTTSKTFTGLTAGTDYTVEVRAVCASSQSAWTSIEFSTLQPLATLPYFCDFETSGNNDWTLRNGTCTNQWHVGSFTSPAGHSGSLFISSDGGTTADYNVNARSVVVAEKLFQTGTSDSLTISFDLTIGGENTWDYLKVYWVNADTIYTADGVTTPYYGSQDYTSNVIMNNATNASYRFVSLLTGTQTMSVTIANEPNTLKKLVFVWRNDSGGGTQPGAIIDNIYINDCDAPTALAVSNITETSAELSWNGTAAGYEVRLNGGTPETVSTTSKTFTGLTAGTDYTVEVRAVCASSQSAWTSIEFSTLQPLATLPYFCDFETSGNNDWTLRNGTCTNQWHVGSFTSPAGHSGSLFISSDGGTTADYNVNARSVVVAEKLFQTGTSDSLTISFDLTIGGENTWDYLKVYWVNADTIYTADGVTTPYYGSQDYTSNVIMSNATNASDRFVNKLTGTQTMSVTIANEPNTLKKLVFVWVNDNNGGTQPGAIIDNLSVAEPCDAPAALAVSNITHISAELSWNGTATGYEVRLNGGTAETVTTTSKTFTGLTAGTDYTVEVRAVCASSQSAWTSIEFSTLQPLATLPYFCDFETSGNNDWTLRNGTCTNQWHVGSFTSPAGHSGSLFISSDGGTTADYNVNARSVVVAEKLFQTGTSDSLTISFDLTIGGENTWDYLKVYWVNADTIYTADGVTTPYYGSQDYTSNVIMSNATNASDRFVNKLTGTQTMSVTIANEPNTLKKLVFVWVNDNNGGTQPGAIIDNLSVAEPCDAPAALAVSNITHISAELSWNGTATGYEVRLNGGTAETVTTTSKTFTGLTAGTDYTVEVRAVCASSQSAWVSTSFTTTAVVVTPPTVNTLAASNITHDGATLNGTITAGSEAITAQGFMYKASSATDWTTVAATGTNLSATVNNLTAETAYEYKAFATTASGTVEGAVESFTTLAVPVVVTPPTVETLAATEVTHEAATLNGTITAGSEAITAQGFMYKASSAADWTTVAATGTNLSATVNNLTAETAYEYKAFATTASGTVEGQVMNFTTLEAPVVVTPPTVETLAATEVTHEAATLNGTITAGSEAITAQGFMYKASSATDWTTVAATGTNLSATVNNLTAETAYEYKAFATTASSTVEGEVINFTTLAASGLADAESGAIKAIIYPNPAKDKATLSLTGLTANAKIIVSDLQGRIIQTEDLQAGSETYELNTSNYASGVYYIRIVSGNNVNTQKLIVE